MLFYEKLGMQIQFWILNFKISSCSEVLSPFLICDIFAIVAESDIVNQYVSYD